MIFQENIAKILYYIFINKKMKFIFYEILLFIL